MKKMNRLYAFLSIGWRIVYSPLWGLIHLCVLLAWRLILWLVDSFQFFTIMNLGFFFNLFLKFSSSSHFEGFFWSIVKCFYFFSPSIIQFLLGCIWSIVDHFHIFKNNFGHKIKALFFFFFVF
jgi:hypothetical protein